MRCMYSVPIHVIQWRRKQIENGGLDSSEIFTNKQKKKKKRQEIVVMPNFAKKSWGERDLPGSSRCWVEGDRTCWSVDALHEGRTKSDPNNDNDTPRHVLRWILIAPERNYNRVIQGQVDKGGELCFYSIRNEAGSACRTYYILSHTGRKHYPTDGR